MLQIDGSEGEGGGQILRSALSLSLITGRPFQMRQIRARRSRPGLMPQHLAAVHAATAVGQASVTGDKRGSHTISFEPRGVKVGAFDFNIGTAGSAPLVLQTLLIPLALSGQHSQVKIIGGTHVRWSPCFHYLDWHWRSFMQQAGFNFELVLLRAGFYPRGGGCLRAAIEAVTSIRPLEIMEPGRLLSVSGLSAVANLSMSIAERQRSQVFQRLIAWDCDLDIELQRLDSPGRGTLLLLLAHYENSQCCFYALGEKGKPAEQVADEAVDQLQAFAATDGAIDPYLADQLILPLALADGTSWLRTSKISTHIITNAGVLQRFLPVEICIHGKPGEPGAVEIRGCGGATA